MQLARSWDQGSIESPTRSRTHSLGDTAGCPKTLNCMRSNSTVPPGPPVIGSSVSAPVEQWLVTLVRRGRVSDNYCTASVSPTRSPCRTVGLAQGGSGMGCAFGASVSFYTHRHDHTFRARRGRGGVQRPRRRGPRTRGLNVDKFYWLDSLLLVVLRISGRSSTNQNKAKS